MKKSVLVLFAILSVMILAPNLKADSFPFSFVAAGGVSGVGTLDATNAGGGTWVVNSATGVFNDGSNSGSITLITNPYAPTNAATSPSGYFGYDDLLFPSAGRGQVLDQDGLIFSFDGMELNFWQTGGPAGTDGWAENSENGGNGTFSLTLTTNVVPEPGTLLLAASGLLGLAAIRLRHAN